MCKNMDTIWQQIYIKCENWYRDCVRVFVCVCVWLAKTPVINVESVRWSGSTISHTHTMHTPAITLIASQCRQNWLSSLYTETNKQKMYANKDKLRIISLWMRIIAFFCHNVCVYSATIIYILWMRQFRMSQTPVAVRRQFQIWRCNFIWVKELFKRKRKINRVKWAGCGHLWSQWQ